VIEERDLFERAVQRFVAPDRSFERLVARRVRKERNRRIGAGLVAAAVAVVGIGVGLRAFQRTTEFPVMDRFTGNGDVTFVGLGASDLDSLYVLDRPGAPPRKILEASCPSGSIGSGSCGGVGITSVDWSPDGTAIAYALSSTTRDRIGSREGIYVLEVTSGQIRRVTSCAAPCGVQTDVDWSPDGTRIAFTEATTGGCDGESTVTGSCSIYTMDPDGTDRVALPTGLVLDPVHPSWSPDGASIAFSGRVGNEWFVHSMAPDGSDLALLDPNHSAPQQNEPAWSPDGMRIAFLSGEGSGLPRGYEIWTIAPDGSSPRLLDEGCCLSRTPVGVPAEGPIWSPDGTRLLQQAGGGVRVLDADTGRVLWLEKRAHGTVAWQPVP
jgi:dipeptidyl aminopeptidase/acylaminoacyl peptidase